MNKITCLCCEKSFNEENINIHKLSNMHINNLMKEIKRKKKIKNINKTDDKFYEWFNNK